MLTAAVAFATPMVAFGQSLPGMPPAATAPPSALPPGVRAEGLYLTAPVTLDGNILFRVATTSTGTAGELQAQLRARIIEDVLQEMIAPQATEHAAGTVFDPKTLRVEVLPDGPQAILSATDETHKSPFPIMTVTTVDARYQRMPVESLAASWRDVLQAALVAALQKRQPGQMRASAGEVIRVGLTLILGTILGWLAVTLIRKRMTALLRQIDRTEREIGDARSKASPDEPEAEERRRTLIDLLLRVADPEMRLMFWRATSALIVWGFVLAWFLAIWWGLSLFPQTAPFAQIASRRTQRAVFIWIGAFVLVRFLDLVIARFAHLTRLHLRMREMKEDEKARQLLRIPTVARALHDSLLGVVIFVAVLATFSALGLPIGSVLTIGGLAAFALSFAAQNLVRDFLNGILVLLEDQYVIGDMVIIDQWTGLVEQMTLRIVQLRDASGNLITIPYSVATGVVNCSRYWSRIDYRIAVAPSADPAKAIAIISNTIQAMAREEKWRDSIVDAVEWTGVESVGAAGIVVRVSVKTAPLRQFELRREINARILTAFAQAGIGLGLDPATTTATIANAPAKPAE